MAPGGANPAVSGPVGGAMGQQPGMGAMAGLGDFRGGPPMMANAAQAGNPAFIRNLP